MFLLQFVILLLPAVVTSAPFDNEEGSTYIPMDFHHGRPRTSSVGGSNGVSPLAFLNSPFVRRGKADPEKPLFQGMLGMVSRDHMDEGALRRKVVWENTIKKEKTRSHPDQVLPIGQDALKRSRCNALPFVQNVFRENCAPVRIPNKFCFGQCNSFYVPGWPVGLSQPCTSCSPVRSRRIFVPLQCRGGRLSWEEVVLVEECSCETRYERDFTRTGSGEGFQPML
ncbi:PREDICTED: DAN domain family member 5-like [Nanorana parkeri]|uniref:DAN domain family member 5-like n=1 Tax=Nanorana parkeri TaxID=125878 RepID=UPI000853FA81|nr:PREDICTED: DAN domain family member 5-like [Nanorana parkeri]